MKNAIPLFYWSERKFLSKDKENYGDLLSKYLVEKISGKKVKWVHPRRQAWYKINKKNYLAVGSIIHHGTQDSIVWGSGVIGRNEAVPNACFKAVRGPFSRNFILKAGFDCPEIYGDPALLLPLYFNPETEKKWKLGIIPHYHDYPKVKDWYYDEEDIKVIDVMTNDIEEVTQSILECENIISSSLHGIIVSHAYDIPALWVEFSDKLFGDGVKFQDYLESVEIDIYDPPFWAHKESLTSISELMKEYQLTPEKTKIKELQDRLLKTCPFITV